MSDAEVTPQVALVSSSPDRPRIEPLVLGLRARGVEVWWDGDSLVAGEEWEITTWAILRSVPITGVVVSEALLVSPSAWSNFETAIAVVLDAGKHLVPVRVGSFDRATPMPSALAQRQWIEIVTPDDLERAIDVLERTVRSLTGQPASGPAQAAAQRKSTPSSSSVPSGSTRSSASSSAIALLLGDATEPETWAVAPDLVNVLEQAARLHPKESGAPRHPLSFSTLLGALFWAGGPWSQWSHGIARESGFATTTLRAIPVTPAEVSRPLRATRSAASLLTSARAYAQRSGVTLDVQHVIAALIYEPAGHESDLDRARFDRVVWANALLAEVERRAPSDAPLLKQLRDEAFPVTPWPAANAPTRGVWSLAEADLKAALAWALAAAPPDSAVVGVRELFAGLMTTLPADSGVWNVLRSVSPDLAGESHEPPWASLSRKLHLVPPASSAPLAGLPPCAPEVETILARVSALPGRLDAMSVFLALWQPVAVGQSAAIDALLPALELDADAFLRGLQEADAGQSPGRGDLRTTVQEIRARRGAFQPWNRPHVDNDRVGGPITEDKDLLDARKPALRFAKLLAARDVNPPIALGLFGHWGSGKTFFMGLMRDRIADLVRTGGDDYVRRVVQIEFNAWHYHDTNLWASLAMRLFEELARELAERKTESDVQAKRKELHQRIRSSEARRSEADDRRTQALTRRSTAVKELETQRARRDDLQRESVRLRLAAGWKVVMEDDTFKALRTTAAGLARHFGISDAIRSVDDLARLRRDIDETSSRALGLFTAIGQRFQGVGRSARTTGLLLLVALAALALGGAFEKTARLLELSLPDVSATVLQVAALVSAATAWCGRRVKEIRGAVDRIGEVEARLADAEKTLSLPDASTKLEAEIAELDKAIHQAGEVLSAADREIAEATAEIDRINRGGLVYDFLQERRAAASYVGQLGLISTIRQDLERLHELLADFVASGENPIERIILYIDDLDRCHPDKVVEVLQAVHLLLAFDLFNVVVGVDARWLERSLRRQYVGRGSAPAQRDDPFSPQDYLEKIFQIPYALSRLDDTSFKSLIGGLIETRTDQAAKARQRARDEAVRAAAAAQVTAGGEGEPRAAVVSAVAAARNAGGRPAAGDGEHEHATDGHGAAAEPSQTGKQGRSSVATPALYFEDHEEQFIQLLYAFIDRPRLAKRFINIYRLLRVRADDEGENVRFAGSSTSPEYRAAAILLAIQVGHPGVAARVIHALSRAKAADTWAVVLESLRQGRIDGVVCTDREKMEISDIASKLTQIGAHVPSEVTAYQRWASRVACYSFDWHRGGG
jgi:hypothetical protein